MFIVLGWLRLLGSGVLVHFSGLVLINLGSLCGRFLCGLCNGADGGVCWDSLGGYTNWALSNVWSARGDRLNFCSVYC